MCHLLPGKEKNSGKNGGLTVNISCEIINDLLPLYTEGLASEDSCHLIEDHLKNCPSCKMLYDNMKKQQTLPSSAGTVPLKKLRKHLLMKKAETIIFVAVLVFSLMVTIFAYLSSPDYIPYSDSVVSCQRTDNAILVKFRKDITRYSVFYDTDDDGNKSATIQAWYTSIDNFFPDTANKTALLTSIPGSVKNIWYCSSNGAEDKLIYGEPELGFGGRITLPKLALGYYTLIAFILAMMGGILLLVFRNNNKVKGIIQKIVFVPISYLIGHICIKGFNTISYSAPRDFSLILLASILVYCLLITGQSLYKKSLQVKNQKL